MPLPPLSASEMEQLRLLLRGGSVVDWVKLQHESEADVDAFLRLQGAVDGDPRDELHLRHLRDAAAAYLTDEHGYKIGPELLSCPPRELFLFASEERGRRRDRFLACLMLKVMHIVHHIEARELRLRLPIAQSELAERLMARVDAFAAALRSEGFPIESYVGGQKALSSLITKLMVKKEYHAAAVLDRVRFRFVVRDPTDLVGLMHAMVTRLFPANYLVPTQTVNHLVSFTSLVESHDAYRAVVEDLNLELGDEEQDVGKLNEFSGPSYRVINFVADIPVRVPDSQLGPAGDDVGYAAVVFVLAEFQIVDVATDQENERGDNRHERYRARQLGIVRARLERGKRGPTTNPGSTTDS